MQKILMLLLKLICGCTLVLLTLPARATAAAAVPLLVNQCLNYSTDFHPDFSSIITLERQTIGLQNINDQVNYYRSFVLPEAAQEALLQCQLAVADAVNRVLISPQLRPILDDLQRSNELSHHRLAAKFQYLLAHQLPLSEKAKLSTAQASIRQHLKSNNFQLDWGSCALAVTTPTVQKKSLSDHRDDTTEAKDAAAPEPLVRNIATYMLQQSDEDCRKLVWRKYQARAKSSNQTMLTTVQQLRLQQAQNAGYNSYVDYLLAEQLMGSADNLSNFLNAFSQRLDIAPWNIGKELTDLKITKINKISADDFMQTVSQRLANIGITHENIDKRWMRLWYRGRLLGELLIATAPKNRHILIRRSVIGQQAGQSQLELKAELKTLRDYQTAVSALSEALTQLAAGGRFYLDNGFTLPQDAGRIGELWLEDYLSQGFPQQLRPSPDSREQLAESYRQHMALFHAYVALEFYQTPNKQPSTSLFSHLFAGQWPEVHDYAYSFADIADTGPLIYESLWQQFVADAIYQTTANCAPEKLFEVLIVNENGADIRQTLFDIWGPDAVTRLIAQIQQGQFHPDHLPQWCPLDKFTP